MGVPKNQDRREAEKERKSSICSQSARNIVKGEKTSVFPYKKGART